MASPGGGGGVPGAECTPPLTLPPPPPFIWPAPFVCTTSPSVPLIGLQTQGVPCQNVETACRLGYVGARGVGKDPAILASMSMSLGISAHARAVWAVDTPHTDVVHANASVRAEKVWPTSLLHLQATHCSDCMPRGGGLLECGYSTAEGPYGCKGCQNGYYRPRKAWTCSLVISAHARAVWTVGTPHTELLPANAPVSGKRVMLNQLGKIRAHARRPACLHLLRLDEQ
jgi:hypothetical protein